MAKTTYWAAFQDKAYEDVYNVHSSTDLNKLIRTMLEGLRKKKLIGDTVILLSKSRIYESSAFQGFWKTKAGSSRYYIGMIDTDGRPVLLTKDGKRFRVLPDGSIAN